ncbi:MAG: sigma-54-dependent transcriptional regulator [Kiloniellales bacterium]
MRILLVEDESLFAEAVAKRLRREGHDCAIAGSLRDALDQLEAIGPALDLLLLDERLPDGRGVDLMRRRGTTGSGQGPGRPGGALPPVIMMTAFADVEHAVGAMKLGAIDYLRKPVDLDALLDAVERAAPPGGAQRAAAARGDQELPLLVGESDALRQLRQRIGELARIGGEAGANGDLPTVLILGETGTGKDLAARLLHGLGPRVREPFVQVDCATLPKELIEAELFGHEKGAFTGAGQQRRGLIEEAGAGTVFLDEVGELPLDLQAKLLAVLDRRRVRRLGSNKETPVSARFVAATNRDLAAMVADGRFRADLFFRLNVLALAMPPLRRAAADIPALVAHFAERTARSVGRPAPHFTPEAMAKLMAHAWPGNVRELRHVIEKAVLLSKGGPIEADETELPAGPGPVAGIDDGTAPGDLANLSLEEAEKRLIERALQRAGGNVSEAARLLNTTRMTLRYRMEKHGIDSSRCKADS